MKLKFIVPLAALGLLFTLGGVYAAGRSIVVKGSDTMSMLGAGWAEAYMKKDANVSISVQGGGSGTGIAAMIAGTCNVCQASRAMNESEVAKCRERNIVPVATIVALDGVAFAVNAKNPVKSLTIAQLKNIYTGKVTNWKQVGGTDGAIVVLSRESTSGTYVYVREAVLNNERYASTVLLMPTTKAIQTEVANNPRAIGYGGEAYFTDKANITVLPIAAKAGAAPVLPTADNVRAKTYPLSRPLYFYTPGKPAGDIAKYITFCLGADGQAICKKMGYVTLK